MTLSNFLPTPDGVVSDKNSGEPEPDELAPDFVQIRRLEGGRVERNGSAKQSRMINPGKSEFPSWRLF